VRQADFGSGSGSIADANIAASSRCLIRTSWQVRNAPAGLRRAYGGLTRSPQVRPKSSIVTPGSDVLAYPSSMRRFLASFVLSVIGCGVLAPVTLAPVAANTLACCRRNGKHHCTSTLSGMAETSSPGGDGAAFSSHPDGCPYRFQASTPTSPAQIHTGVFTFLGQPTASRPADVGLLFHPARRSQDNSQRGPPSFSL
jgi:hypothetical protein